MTTKPSVKKSGDHWIVEQGESEYGPFISRDVAFDFAVLITERIRKECI